MKKIGVICLMLFSCIGLKASPQSPDYLIIDGDTITIYSLPLFSLADDEIQNFYDIVSSYENDNELPLSFNLWRGYNLSWELSSDRLYLTSIIGNKNSDDILQKCFSDRYKNGKVHADWFNGVLIQPKGEVLRWDGIFSRTCMKENILKFKNGELETSLEISNYIHISNGISRINLENPYEGYPKTIVDTIFQELKKLDWTILSEINDCECDDRYIIEINEEGVIDRIEHLSWVDDNDVQKQKNDILAYQECIDRFLLQLKNLQFDIIKWNGEPFKEQILINLFYSEDDGLELFD